MSDWEKTVLPAEQIRDAIVNLRHRILPLRPSIYMVWEEIAQVQAKETWPIAYDKCLADAEVISTQMAYEAGKEQGRREERSEMMEWLKVSIVASDYHSPEAGCQVISIAVVDWDAKFEELEKK